MWDAVDEMEYDLNNRIDDLRSEISSLERDVEYKEGRISDLESETAGLKDEIKNMEIRNERS